MAIVGATVAGVAFLLLWILKAALTPLAVAFALAYLLDPLIERFERQRVRRSVAIFLLLAVITAGWVGFLAILLPQVQDEVASLAQRLPGYVDRVVHEVVPRLESTLGVTFPRTLTEALQGIRAGELALPAGTLQEILSRILEFFTGTVGAVVGLLVIPVLAYYLLVEFNGIPPRVLAWVPPRHRGWVHDRARTVDRLVSGFVRGQLIVAVTLGLLYAAGFALIGIDLAIGIGLLSGALALIPYLGGVMALVAASLLCVLKFGFDVHLLLVLGWYALVQGLEGFVLTPRIVGQSVGLHPAVVIVALLIGGDLLGFLGLLVAVPAAAVAKVFLGELLDVYRASTLYGPEPS